MSMGRGYHRVSEQRLHQRTRENGGPAPVVTSAGALVDGLHAIGAKKVSILAPYMKPLTQLVIDYIEHEGIEVVDSISLEIADNLEVGTAGPARADRDHAQAEDGGRGRRRGLGLRADAFAALGATDRGPHRVAGRVVVRGDELHDAQAPGAVDRRAGLRRPAVRPLLKRVQPYHPGMLVLVPSSTPGHGPVPARKGCW